MHLPVLQLSVAAAAGGDMSLGILLVPGVEGVRLCLSSIIKIIFGSAELTVPGSTVPPVLSVKMYVMDSLVYK